MLAYTFYEADYRVRRYAEELASSGHRVDVIVLRKEGEKRQGFLNGVNINRIQKREFNEKRLITFIFRNILFFAKSSVILLAKHLRYRYRIIHVHNAPDFLVFTCLIPKLLGAKIILDMHENMPEFYSTKFNKGSETLPVRLLLFLEKISTNFADRVIAAHDMLRDRIINRDGISPKNCTALLNYPNLAIFMGTSTRAENNHFKLIYPGTISYHHGLDVAIKALAIVKREFPGVRLDIYARSRNSTYYDSLIELIDTSNLKNNVKFFDSVPAEEIGKILSNATVGIVPKRAGLFASEAFSTKILEFMAAGLPVIASKTKIDEYYFTDSMIMFFEPENVLELAKCILELWKNPAKRGYLVKGGNEFIGKNNWESKKEIYHKIIDDLISPLGREKSGGFR